MFPPLNGEMPSIEAVIKPGADGGLKNNEMGKVVTIMDRIAGVAERKGTSTASGYPQVIVFHFTKNEYDLPMPVVSENFDVPLISLVKEVKTSNKYFFSFKSESVDLVKNKSAHIAVV